MAQNGSRLDRDDGARRLGTPTALQLLSPLDDAIAIAATCCFLVYQCPRQREGEEVAFDSRAESEAAIKRDEAGWGISKSRAPLATISA